MSVIVAERMIDSLGAPSTDLVEIIINLLTDLTTRDRLDLWQKLCAFSPVYKMPSFGGAESIGHGGQRE